ncbi:PAAR domain-containing protein [Sulfidibacter corallicola]|nr:PAAR domain-containing protein [Sulfidibacter corallicola]
MRRGATDRPLHDPGPAPRRTAGGASTKGDTMGKPAARFTDTTVCPMPMHGAGAIYMGAKTVVINKQAAARVGDLAMCPGTAAQAQTMSNAKSSGSPMAGSGCDNNKCSEGPGGSGGGGGADSVVMGSATVTIEGAPAARLGDTMSHGGKIMSGSTNVTIGG